MFGMLVLNMSATLTKGFLKDRLAQLAEAVQVSEYTNLRSRIQESKQRDTTVSFVSILKKAKTRKIVARGRKDNTQSPILQRT
jgi:hypothetical protein